MLGLIFIFIIGMWLVLMKDPEPNQTKIPDLLVDKVDKYWEVAQKSIKEGYYMRAERALLTILKVDDENAAAYNRLGIIYTKEGNFEDAVECFEIAQSLEPTANNLHNVGLIYYNLGEYKKSILAYEQALEIDNNLAIRYIAYAKALEKNHELDKSIKALEKSIAIEESPVVYKMLAVAYHKKGDDELAKTFYQKSRKMVENQIKLTATVSDPKNKSAKTRIVQ